MIDELSLQHTGLFVILSNRRVRLNIAGVRAPAVVLVYSETKSVPRVHEYRCQRHCVADTPLVVGCV